MAQSTWQTRTQLFAVLILFWLYLVIGAVIFTAIERPHANDLHRQYVLATSAFMANNSCVHPSDLRAYSNVLIDILSDGLRWNADHGFNSSKQGYHHWELIDSLFFCATVITTIGYGHLAPSTNLGRSICIVYALIGIPLSGLLVTTIGLQLKKRLKGLWERLIARLRCITSATSSLGRRVALTTSVIMVGVTFYVLLIILPACVFNYIEGWDWLTSQYYAFISFTTIGFGDFVAGDSPTLSVVGRIAYKVVLIFYLVFGMGFVTMLLQSMQKHNAQRVEQLAKKRVIRKIIKRRRVRKVAKADMPDGEISKRLPSDGDEFVVITDEISEDDSQMEQYEMEDLESGMNIETVSVIDYGVQTISVKYCEANTQTDGPYINDQDFHSNRKTTMHDGSTMTTSPSPLSSTATLNTWKITENTMCSGANFGDQKSLLID